MICKKCGMEIKDGNIFCTNCGTSINEKNINIETKQQNKKEIKSNFKFILPIIIVIIMTIVGITIFLISKNKKTNNIDTSDNTEQIEQTTDTKIEIGIDYNIISDNDNGVQTLGFIRFNTNTDYIMELGDYGSEKFTKTGNYTINQNDITLTVNYDSSEYEETTTPYTEKIKILEDDILEYTDKNEIVYKFSKNSTTNNEEQTTSLLNQIYAKYPEYKNNTEFICTNGNEYWLLDNNGNKVYFDSLETFESALKKFNNTSTVEENTNTNNTTTSNNSSNKNDDKHINISELIGKTEKEAVSIMKKRNIPYEILYKENLDQEEGIVLGESYLNRGSYFIYINKYEQRTLKINLHRSCLAEQFKKRTETTLSQPLNVIVKANDTIIFNDKLTNADLRESNTDDCKTSLISYTGKTPPVITIIVNGTVFRTYDKEMTRYWLYYENTESHDLGFTEHGAG